MPAATLFHFAQVNDRVAATTKKLEKYELLATWFRGLEPDDLRLAVRFAAGRAFAATDGRVLNVGGALVGDVALSLIDLPPADFHDLCVRNGEMGEGLAAAWTLRRPVTLNSSDDAVAAGDIQSSSSLLLRDLAASFDLIATTGDRERKSRVLLQLLVRCVSAREAAYLLKILFGDLRTGVQEGVLQSAIAQAFDKPLAEIRRAQLLLGDLEEVAVLASQNALETAQFRLFHPLQFMLATPEETADDAAATMEGRAFLADDKLDGIRAQVHKSGEGSDSRVQIYTRTLDRIDAAFPEVVETMRRLPGDFLLDGEIVPWADGQVLPFAHIQKRLGRKAVSAKIRRENPCAFIAFDILFRDDDLLMDRPLSDRRAALESLASTTVDGLLVTHPTAVRTTEEIQAAFDAARGRRNEGIVLKDPASAYAPGRRGQAWLKLKTHLPTIDCVVTFAETGHGKRKGSLSDYTFAVWDRDPAEADAILVNVGKAYSGVTDEEIAQLTQIFTELTTEQLGRVRRVTPKIVLEIACDQIQKSTRHASGYALRFPRIKRIRWDKRPEEADRLLRVVEIYESSPNFAKSDKPTPTETPEPTLFDGLI